MWNAQRTAVQCRPVGLSDSNQINQIQLVRPHFVAITPSRT